ncbi:metallophosphoesterase family protein [Terrihalobacillus insolitus]|uniref:metallophosphoesterase family protein n=1 Tax=Terrihalobacillus insolitus TaxID=2950438 RepID=UPI002340B95F|nr:DNA repair exonuclease [Terrihalobacillus insolitus]MDC3413540.1 DNA repair exonuclease [Terrihalobacillus insolitus]
MQKRISFIHCADLHLDSPFDGLSHVQGSTFTKMKDSTFHALERLVDLAIEKQVDFVLMVGDLFDGAKQSLRAQLKLKQSFQRLQSQNIDVYMSFGNHDYTSGRTFSFHYPSNVHLFESEKVTHFTHERDGIPLANIYGFSYENRAIFQNKANEFYTTDENRFHIGMLHGSISTNTEHDVYAPFQLGDLNRIPMDYWALGHIHKREILKENPPIVYPGNLQGRSKKEQGEKGCYYVELAQNDCKLTFCPLQTIRFDNVTIDISTCSDVQQLTHKVERHIDDIRAQFGSIILNVELRSNNEKLDDWYHNGYINEIFDLIHESYEEADPFVIIQDYSVHSVDIWDKNELKKGQHFVGELLRLSEDYKKLEHYLEPILSHREARKYVDRLTDKDKEEIIEQAQSLLLHSLMEEE